MGKDLTVPVCPSVFVRSKPATVPFKAAGAPRGGRNPSLRAEQIRGLRTGILPRLLADRLRLSPRLRTLKRRLPPVLGDRTEGQAGTGRNRFGREEET